MCGFFLSFLKKKKLVETSFGALEGFFGSPLFIFYFSLLYLVDAQRVSDVLLARKAPVYSCSLKIENCSAFDDDCVQL